MSENSITHYNLRSRKEDDTSKSGEDISSTGHLRRLSIESSSDSKHIEPEMADANRTLKELAAPTFVQPLCIQYPQVEVGFELKSGMNYLFSTFHGFAEKDPNKHLKEFYVVCSSMKPTGGLITTWNEMQKLFLEMYFPASKATNIIKEICSIRQSQGKNLYEYWERFKRLCAICPNHQISEQLLLQYFYEGLLPMERSMIDAVSGGALMDKTLAVAMDLIANMATNSQQFGSREVAPVKQISEVGATSQIERQLAGLTSLMQQMALGTMQQAKSYDPYANTYNPGFRDHPNLSYGGNHFIAPQSQFNHPPGFNQQRQRPQSRIWRQQVRQLANTVGELEAQGSGKLSSQAINLRENASVVTLRSGKILEEAPRKMKDQIEESTQEKNLVCGKDEATTPTAGSNVESKCSIPTYVPSIPFFGRFAKSKKDEHEKEILETLREVQVNIPLLDAIYQVPRYAKFLKDLCTNKHRLKGCVGGCFGEGKSIDFSTDFYVLDMQDEPTTLLPPLLLGRPFMKIARIKIDVYAGTLTMEFDDSLVQRVFELSNEDVLDTTLIKSIDANNLTGLSKNL
ncbi:uncharacterized protein LOC111398207 [Olea europaea var. sylvestris]|uniref:uncharacterized protein LOC111398207 n=1 Tax=Olea europaea var. sylvestris TaxID=158386 RepID=UPI000C1D8BC5|nr:uncharacterized protein LOC111398207 [Olea europaea var. sylvestris]